MTICLVGAALSLFPRRGARSHLSTRALKNVAAHRISSKANFLEQIDGTVGRVLEAHPDNVSISNLRIKNREELAIARRLNAVLHQFCKDGKCPRCWMKEAFCICAKCPPLESLQPSTLTDKQKQLHPKINRIFVLMHHRELFLSCCTAKLILAAFPKSGRLVIAGIGPEFQASMKEMVEAMGVGWNCTDPPSLYRQQRKCLVLFPTPEAKTFADLLESFETQSKRCRPESSGNVDDGWDLIVVDGTWAQARKIHDRYISAETEGGPLRVKLSQADLDHIGSSTRDTGTNVSQFHDGRQLRKHPIRWKEIGTMEALRLLFRDMLAVEDAMGSSRSHPVWETMARYQDIANAAATQQRGRSAGIGPSFP